MVDYSRWDKLDVSDDEEDRKKPRVQAFKEPQKVTIGGQSAGGGVHVRPSTADTQPVGVDADVDEADEADEDEPMEPPSDEDVAPGEDHREDVLQLRALAERALQRGEAAEAVRLLEKAAKFGGASCPGFDDFLAAARAKASGGGGSASSTAQPAGAAAATDDRRAAAGGLVEGRYRWSQTRDTVEVNVFVPDGTKAKAVSCVKVTEEDVQVVVAGESVLKGQWEFKVEPEEDPDWELRDLDGRRVLRLLVRKKPMPGGLSIVVWWKRVLKGDPAIDVGEIEGRKKERIDQFSKAWADAHLAFREKAAKRTPVQIDLGSGEVEPESMETS